MQIAEFTPYQWCVSTLRAAPPLWEGSFSTRTANCLLNLGIVFSVHTLEDVAALIRPKDFLALPQAGKKSLSELVEILAAHGLRLRDNKLPCHRDLLAMFQRSYYYQREGVRLPA